MSPGSGVKSEYMKHYREPRWDEYAPCYRELLRYRLGRRRLEQAHAPWPWEAWGPDCASDDSASSSASGPEEEASEASAREEPERPVGERGAEAGDEQDAAQPFEEQQTREEETDRLPAGVKPRQQPSALFARGSRKAVRSPQRSSTKIKGNKHPFALYGWGERETDTGSHKTHNVCASASVQEIHESALRARSRRQEEKRKLAAQRQHAHSVEGQRGRTARAPPAENPWVTEYMRCFSARA
ncbi:centriole, cilia and spindle-associated protein-like [Ictidomys tridecemlineatus]|uniref:centriole, cilia and spindle-associated protein-like n=1 Tax=Ictidomys tridecemlineatus TaxID=43179 RepID=UPI00025DE5B9|nr:centriole, cilia and spindle-associated protein-like [Ictidomys tridecemlineatus]KAG3294469.1 centriole, cilia and spindle-associated protein-like [Ictidomys tridecemlineatus]